MNFCKTRITKSTEKLISITEYTLTYFQIKVMFGTSMTQADQINLSRYIRSPKRIDFQKK